MRQVNSAVYRVLVIDDDDVMRDVLSLVLASAGYTAEVAASGEEALAHLARLSTDSLPQCVLTDLQMPGLSGGDLATKLRDALPGSTLLAMSGTEATIEQARAFDGFLLKPFALEDFTQAMANGDVGRGNGWNALPVLADAIYSKLKASIPEPQLHELYLLCLTDSEARISRMRAAAVAGDAETFVREAHAVKGGCGMLGATELHELASRMEAGALACTPLLDEFTEAAERLRRMLESHS